MGVVVPSLLTRDLLGISRARSPAEALVTLRNELLRRLRLTARVPTLEGTAARLLTARRGAVAIDAVAAHYGVSRQRFARRFHEATGMPPKLFARITRFQGLVYSLLSTDVSEWAVVAPGAGFYDQAHMINEFRSFTGAPPTTFFQPHDAAIEPARIQVRGRPSEVAAIRRV
jgi:AraC-like DNA-binding protein